MADIDVVKKGSRTWMWIVLAIVIVLALWFLMAGTRGPQVYRIDGGQPHAAAFPNPALFGGAVLCDSLMAAEPAA